MHPAHGGNQVQTKCSTTLYICDVRLLSLTAIKGWKSQHWFIWRVLSPSGPFQALTKITEKDQQDQ